MAQTQDAIALKIDNVDKKEAHESSDKKAVKEVVQIVSNEDKDPIRVHLPAPFNNRNI